MFWVSIIWYFLPRFLPLQPSWAYTYDFFHYRPKQKLNWLLFHLLTPEPKPLNWVFPFYTPSTKLTFEFSHLHSPVIHFLTFFTWWLFVIITEYVAPYKDIGNVSRFPCQHTDMSSCYVILWLLQMNWVEEKSLYMSSVFVFTFIYYILVMWIKHVIHFSFEGFFLLLPSTLWKPSKCVSYLLLLSRDGKRKRKRNEKEILMCDVCNSKAPNLFVLFVKKTY